MTIDRDPDEILSAWLDEGPIRLPDQTRRAIGVAIPVTAQRRHIVNVPWRFNSMSTTLKLAVGAMAVIAVVLGGALALGRWTSDTGPGGVTTPSASPSASVGPSAAPIDTSAWIPYSSDRYAYDMRVPTNWTTRPAERDWALDIDQRDFRSTAADGFIGPGGQINASVFAAFGVAYDTTTEAWIAEYLGPDATGTPNPCPAQEVDLGMDTVDGRPVTFRSVPDSATCGETYAFVRVDDRIYVFAIWRPDTEALLKAYLSTVQFRSAARWVPYTSERYGISGGYPARWTARPSEREWTYEADATDPVSPAQESFLDPDGHVRVSAWSVPLDPGTKVESSADIEAWVTAYCEKTGNTPCTGLHDRAVPLCLERRDCHPGLLVPFKDDIQAFFPGGNDGGERMTVVVVWRGESDPNTVKYGGSRQLLEAFLSTMSVWPESVPFEQRQERVAPVS